MSVIDEVSDRIYGIDLGTTYSCISYVDESSGVPVVIENADGALTTPSVVHFREAGGEALVGQKAKNALATSPERTFAFVKRSMGGEDRFQVDGEEKRPETLSALILQKLVQDASTRLDQQGKLQYPIKRVVITVPAYFGQSERNATKAAGKIAGLEVVDIINEPTAAALAYRSAAPESEERVLVYDLGGGTFDISFIDIGRKNIRELRIAGDSHRGGVDWDEELRNLIVNKFVEQYPDLAEAKSDDRWLKRLLQDVESLKKTLSDDKVASDMFVRDKRAAQIEVTREEFEDCTDYLLDGTLELVKDVISEVKTEDTKKPRRVMLVGGSSKMPAVKEKLNDLLTRELGASIPVELRDPDLAVAKGAAFHGFILRLRELLQARGGDFGPILEQYPKSEPYLLGGTIFHVLTRSLGVKALDKGNPDSYLVAHILHANERLPAEGKDNFLTLRDGQSAVELPVCEQAGSKESSDPDHNKVVGAVVVDNLGSHNLPAGSRIDVTFRAEEDGALHVNAVEPKSGQSAYAEFRFEGGMTDAEIDREVVWTEDRSAAKES